MARPVRPSNIGDVIGKNIGQSAICPKCGNAGEFTVYMKTDVVSVNITSDDRVGRSWMITEPNLGMLKVKDLRCCKCGNIANPRSFIPEDTEAK